LRTEPQLAKQQPPVTKAEPPSLAAENGRWKGYRHLLMARMKELWREPEVIFWVFVFPILLALGLGIAFRSKPPDVSRVAVVEGPEAARAMSLLKSSSNGSIPRFQNRPDEAW
jgi:hypothetical protein